MKRELAAATRRSDLADREKERVSIELLRALERAEKLQGLCRELQKQREAVGDESKRLLAEEQTKRQALSRKLSLMVKDIQGKLDERELEREQQQKALDREAALAQENAALHASIAAILEKDVAREQHFASQLRAKELEAQLADARQRQSEELMLVERERARLIAERAALTEQQLSDELRGYAGKCAAFQSTLSASTDGLGKLRAQLERSTKHGRQLERANAELSARLSRATEQRARLEALCRSLQDERRQSRARASRTAVASGAAGGPPAADAPTDGDGPAEAAELRRDGQGADGPGEPAMAPADDGAGEVAQRVRTLSK